VNSFCLRQSFLDALLKDSSILEHEPNPEQNSVLAQEVYAQDLLPPLVNNLANMEFEVTPGLCCAVDFVG